MPRAVLLTTISILAVGVAAGAQMPGANAGQMADMMNFQAAMMKAQAAAVRPGDEALGCDALGKELVTLMDSPAMKAYAAKSHGAPVKQTTDATQQMKELTPVLPALMRTQRLMSMMALKGCALAQ